MFSSPDSNSVNNEIYNHLGERWYEASDDPIALLRAEAQLRNQWVIDRIQPLGNPCPVLDIGCGGGFLSNPLARSGFTVTGLDQSEDALETARQWDCTGRVKYIKGNAYELPFAENSFDAVFAMDFLEHVEDPQRVIDEASRVLKPNGRFFFYTFNRNWLSRLLVIKGVEWFVKNTPRNLHIYRLFIKPREMKKMLDLASLNLEKSRGVRPQLRQKAMWNLIRTGSVDSNFKFVYTDSLAVGYMGYATKKMPC